MYNLLISGNAENWEGQPFTIELGRCVREYTDDAITAKYGKLTEQDITEIRRMPCVFAYENGCDKDPKFGQITNISKRGINIRIEYEIIPLTEFIQHSQFPSLIHDLDVDDWELNRTHWAIKDIDLAKALARHDIHLPSWARKRRELVDITKHSFEVGLSFPGEVRNYVESVAEELERAIGPNTFFYDNRYKSQLARPSLNELLQEIYRTRCKLIVVFICSKYQEKDWCGIEFRAIQEILMERVHTKIMFVRMDDGDVKGVFKTDGYIDGRTHPPREIATFIEERLSILNEAT